MSRGRGGRNKEAGVGIRSVLAIPDARRIQWADAISGTGDGLYWVALVVVLARSDGGSGLLAAAVVARLIPRLLFGAVAGVLVDRVDRRRLLMALDAARGVLMVLLAAVVAAGAPPVAVVVIVFVVGTLGTPYRPAMAVLLATSVGERLLAPANALSLSIGQVVALTGPLLAAVALAIIAPAWAFIANAVTFAAAFVLISKLRPGPAALVRLAPAESTSWLTELRAGAATVRRQDGIAVLIGLASILTLVRGAEMVLYARFAESSLGLGASGYGMIAGAVGAGALIALPYLDRATKLRAESPALVMAAVCSVIPLILLSVVDNLPLAFGVLLFQGAATLVFEVLALTSVQRLCPATALGRVLGMQSTFAGGSKVLGSLLAPVFIAVAGIDAGLISLAVIALGGVAMLAPATLGLGRRMGQTQAELASIVDRLGVLGIFASVPRSSLERLAMNIVPELLPAGAALMREGDPADDFYVVVSGTLEVTAAGAVVNHLGPDNWCGEIGLLRRAPRSATITATIDTIVWRLPGNELISALTAGVTLPTSVVEDMTWRIAHRDAVVASATEHGPPSDRPDPDLVQG